MDWRLIQTPYNHCTQPQNMSRPPRIPNWLPDDQSTIYFITFCVEERKPVLANSRTWSICCDVLDKLDQWTILNALAMPDHIHMLAAPADRGVGSTRQLQSQPPVSPSEGSNQPGNGKKAVLIDYFDPTNLSAKSGNISARIRFVRASSPLRTIGRINFNSTSKRRLTQTPYK